MNILQISAPKSGSYWLHSILKQIYKKKNLPMRSFIKNQEAYQKVKHLELSFKDQAGVDMIDIEEDGCYYRISSVVRNKILDPADYAKSTNLAWTHSTLCSTSFEVFPLFDKKICMVRDPRDRALSAAKFAFTSYMKKYHPSPYSNREEYMENEFGRMMQRWVWFVGNYLLYSEELNIHLVYYENLLNDFESELNKMLEYLEITLSTQEKQEIKDAMSFSTMKEKSPNHLHKGQYGKWVNSLADAKKELAIENAGDLMNILNYRITSVESQRTPSTPSSIPKKELKKMLENISWYEIYKT